MIKRRIKRAGEGKMIYLKKEINHIGLIKSI